MASITFAMTDDEHQVPGIDCALASGLFAMHAQAVRTWLFEQRAAAGSKGLAVIADDDWLNPGGYESLTVPVSQMDIDALAVIRERYAAVRAGIPHDCQFAALVNGYAFRCRSHAGEFHHFAARWPACPAPFCLLQPDHGGLHDIPPGSALTVDRPAIERDENAGIEGDPDDEVIYDREGHGWHLWGKKGRTDG